MFSADTDLQLRAGKEQTWQVITAFRPQCLHLSVRELQGIVVRFWSGLVPCVFNALIVVWDCVRLQSQVWGECLTHRTCQLGNLNPLFCPIGEGRSVI